MVVRGRNWSVAQLHVDSDAILFEPAPYTIDIILGICHTVFMKAHQPVDLVVYGIIGQFVRRPLCSL